MALYGYARVSSNDQDLTLQKQALRAAGCEVIRAEKASGTSREGRTELQLLLDFLRPGDTLVVTRVDRLARSIKDLQDIVFTLKKQGFYAGTAENSASRDIDTAFPRLFRQSWGRHCSFADATFQSQGTFGRTTVLNPIDVLAFGRRTAIEYTRPATPNP